ncbi:Hsp20/alpha crystallin family protein [Paenibacillus puerhi]|uniref:Hsp20/alpha crystallin family protein n=1 Tax=Paenibacillus puerhi TaxID=2692622 RepID=UPI00135A7BFE|nr:Hsp20/alpha crystallin family protein [Paenibacillus puerhi]
MNKSKSSNSSHPNPYFDMNWKQFEQFFGGKIPFPPASSFPGDLSWVEGYIKDIMKQAMPQAEVKSLKHHYHMEVFETHKNVIVKVHIPDQAQARKARVLLNVSTLRLEGLPQEKTQTVRLPSLISPATCKAVYRNGILQLHMRKQSAEHPFYEIDVRF